MLFQISFRKRPGNRGALSTLPKFYLQAAHASLCAGSAEDPSLTPSPDIFNRIVRWFGLGRPGTADCLASSFGSASGTEAAVATPDVLDIKSA